MPIDSNPAQFARRGNPWITRREQQELGNSPVSKGQRKRNRKARPCDLPYRDIKRIAREPTPEERKAADQRAMLAHVNRLGKALRGETVREVTGYEPRVEVQLVRKAPREAELGPWDRERLITESERLVRETRHARIEAKLGLGEIRAAAELDLGPLAL